MGGRRRPVRRLPLKGFLVTGTDTGAGKTFAACLLGRRLAREGLSVRPLKPVESGCLPGADGALFPADAAALRDAVAPALPLSKVCLYALAAPLSPHLAARREGVGIDPGRIREAVARALAESDVTLVEGAGGIAVEIRDGYTFADLAREAKLPALVVAEDRLGVLNHLTLTLHYLRDAGVELAGVILNERTDEASPARKENGGEVARIAGERYLGRIPHGALRLPEELFSRFRAATI